LNFALATFGAADAAQAETGETLNIAFDVNPSSERNRRAPLLSGGAIRAISLAV
jgi:hypothetical protein